jgi:hypothetical protein
MRELGSRLQDVWWGKIKLKVNKARFRMEAKQPAKDKRNYQMVRGKRVVQGGGIWPRE